MGPRGLQRLVFCQRCFFLLFLSVLKQVPSHLSCVGEHCLPWRSRNALWTTRLHMTSPLAWRETMMMTGFKVFGWTVPLTGLLQYVGLQSFDENFHDFSYQQVETVCLSRDISTQENAADVNLTVALEKKSQETVKVSRIHPLETTNICTICQS